MGRADKYTNVLARMDFFHCSTLKISENVWECLEKTRCKCAVTYGGEMFCRHPSAKIPNAKPSSATNSAVLSC